MPATRTRQRRPPANGHTQPVRHYRSMTDPTDGPRRRVDRTGDPDGHVGSAEAARMLDYPRPEKLPPSLLARADDTERNDDGTVKRRTWRRATIWHYADTVLNTTTTTINGRPALDRTGIAAHLGIHISRVDAFIAGSPDSGLPAPAAPGWYFADDIDTWHEARVQAIRDALTDVDTSGDPDELVNKATTARIVGYAKVTSLDHSPIWARLLQLNNPDDNEPLPGGGQRLRFPRRTVWEAAAARTGKRGRPRGATRTVDTTGDPDEYVGAAEATRILGYKHQSGLPKPLLALADDPGPPRRWKRETLWKYDSKTNTGT